MIQIPYFINESIVRSPFSTSERDFTTAFGLSLIMKPNKAWNSSIRNTDLNLYTGCAWSVGTALPHTQRALGNWITQT